MASSLYGESKRKYSWWWDSHISPKNSKWLQENLTDMDRNVKAMIKLIEEDADSFAKRAEMYYKKRPELMKIAEEFYRAYRALAERYDHATGALRQAHKTMAEAFPNQIPPIMTDDSPSSVTEFCLGSPEMSSPMRGFLDFDDSLSKKGLKQLKEMFPSSEGKVKKALSFKEEEEGSKSEIKRLQEEMSQLSLKNDKLMREMTVESQRAQALQDAVYEFESGKQDALFRFKNSIERISILETGISNTRFDLNEVNDQMTAQLNSIKEQVHAMESVSGSLQLKLETQQKELNKKARELEELSVVIEKEQEKRVQAEVALMSLEQMHTHSQDENERLSLEVQCGIEKLKDMEASKAVLEERINEHNVIISNLQEQNLSYDAKIKDMQNEMQLLKVAKEKLEYELSLNMEENKALRKEVDCLENSLSSAKVEIEGLKVSSNALEAFCETLVSEISTHSVEKGVLVSYMENISDHMESLEAKNSFLENSLADASTELENLRARFKDMEESCMSLCDQNSSLLFEKNNLVFQVENLDSKYLKLQNQYSDLEKEKDSKIHELLDLQRTLSLEKQEHDAVVWSMSSQLETLHNQISHLKVDFEMEQHKFMNSSLECFVLQNCLRDMKDKDLFLFGEYQSALEACKCAENKISCQIHAEYILKREIASLMERNKELSEGFHLLMDVLKIDVKNRSVDKGLVQSIFDEIRNILNSVIKFRDENIKLHRTVENLDNQYLELLDKHSNLMREKDAMSYQLIELQNSLIQEKEHYENLLSKLKEEINRSAENIKVEQQKVMNSPFEVFVLQRCLCDLNDTNLSLLGERNDILEEYGSAKNQIVELKNKVLFQTSEIEILSAGNAVLHKGIHLLLEDLNVDVNGMNTKGTINEMTLQNISGEIKNLKNSVSNFRDENEQLYLKVENLDSRYLELLDKHSNLQRDKDAISHQLLELQTSLIQQKEHHKTLVFTLNEEINHSVENIKVEQQKVMHSLFEIFVLQRCICDMKDTNLCLLGERHDILEASRRAENLITEFKNKELFQTSEIETLSEDNVVLHKGILMLLEELNIDVKDINTEGTIHEMTFQNILGEIKNLKISASEFQDENKQLLLKINDLERNLLALHEERTVLEKEKYFLQNHVQLLQKEYWDIDGDYEMEQQRTTHADIENLVLQGCIYDMCDKALFLSDKCDRKDLIHKEELTLIFEALKINIQNVTMADPINRVTLQTILSKIKNLASYISDAHDENQLLSIEKLVFGTILNQIRLDKLHLFNEFEHRTLELYSSESKRRELMEMNEELKVENDNFLSQIEVLRESMEILETKCLELEDKRSVLKIENEELESSLKSTANEHLALIMSSKNQLAYLETQLYQLQKEMIDKEDELCNENERLHLEVKSTGHDLEILKMQYSELEEKTMNLEKENEDLEKSLKFEKQGHNALISSSKSQVSTLENQVYLVQKERMTLEDELLTEQQKTMNALLENFIFQRCLLDTKDTNLTLFGQHQNLLEASRCSDKLISKLEHEFESQTIELLSTQTQRNDAEKINQKLNTEIKILSKEKQGHNALISSSKSQISTLENQVELVQKERMTLVDELLAEQHNTMNALLENFILQRCLLDTKDTNLTLSGQYQNLLEASRCSDKLILELKHELERQTIELLSTQNQRNDAEKINQKLNTEIEMLSKEKQGHNALISSSKCQISTLENQVYLVQEERMTLEDELLTEQQKTMNALLENFIWQRCLLDTKDTNLTLFGQYQNLLEAFRCSDKLISEMKHELESQTTELLSTQKQRNDAEKMNQKLITEIEILRKELIELHNSHKNLEIEVCKLREEKHFSSARLEALETENSVIFAEAMKLEHLYIFFKSLSIERGFKLKLASNLAKDLYKKIETKKNMLTQKEMEISEFQKENNTLYENLETANLVKKELENEIRALSSCLSSKDEHMIKSEGEIKTLLSDCSLSVLNASVFEDKVYELVEECERLDFLSILHKEKLHEHISLNNVLEKKRKSLERENDDLKAYLKSSFDAIACIEEHQVSLAKLSGIQDDSLMVITTAEEGINDPHKLIVKVELLQKVINTTQHLLELERLGSKAKIESLMKEIEELKLKKSPFQEFSKEKYAQTIKDIQLDQASHSYKASNNESDDQMLELWEENIEEDDIAEEIKSEYPSCELRVDKLETFTRAHDNESPRSWSKICNKKLDSDLKKLLMIQKSLQELKIKLESLEKKKHLKTVEYSTLKEHIQDAEVAILEQVDIYGTLKQKVEEHFESSNAVIWEKERRSISEKARKGSVKIENLESELQKIEYLVLKVQEEEENKRKLYLERKSSSTLLSEYIYSEDEVKEKKKGRFCRCIRPKTKN